MNRLILILESIRSVHNVGSILRSADGMGDTEVWCVGYTPSPDDPRVQKTALGAVEQVSWRRIPTIRMAQEALEKEGYTLWSLELTDESQDLRSVTPLPSRLALICGNEVHGVSQEALSLSQKSVHLPMRGVKTSYNVSIAAALAMACVVWRGEV